MSPVITALHICGERGKKEPSRLSAQSVRVALVKLRASAPPTFEAKGARLFFDLRQADHEK
jgi:hypothetical protein